MRRAVSVVVTACVLGLTATACSDGEGPGRGPVLRGRGVDRVTVAPLIG
ncbi:hypothetical protein ACFYO2_44510 [Streptomyces sp. NPDC006602]